MNERAEILRRLQAGEITPEEAQQELLAFYLSRGANERDAGLFALADIQESSDVETAPVAETTPSQDIAPLPVSDPVGIPRPGPVFGTDLESLPPGERRGPAFSPFNAERGTAFRDFRQEVFPQGLSNRGRAGLNAQFGAISPFFDPQRALGNIPADADFRDFIRANIGQQGFDPLSSAREIGGIFGQDFEESDPRFALRESLIANPNRQVDLAFAAANQGFPAPFSGNLRQIIEDRNARFRASQPIDPLTGLPGVGGRQFLPSFLRNNFGGR